MDITDLLPFSPQVGYVGLALVSFFLSLIPFVPLPSFAFLATMSAGDTYNLHLLAVISAVFAATAKLFIFYIGYSGRRIMKKSTVKRMRPIERVVKKYGAAAAFIAAATPIPDDLIYIPLGLARYNPLRFFLYTLAGKFVISYVTIIAAHHLGPSVLGGLTARIDNSTDVYIAVGFLVVILGIIVALMIFIDWTKIIGRFAPWALEDEEDK